MSETAELARPYAMAAFHQARDEDKLGEWAEMLASLVVIVRDPTMSGLIVHPKVDNDQLAELILDVAGERLSKTGRNFVRVLSQYGRLGLVADIASRFNAERARLEGRSEVRVTSAFELSEEQRTAIANDMSERLGTQVDVSVEVDRALIGGVIIRAGDLVIDASLRGRLAQLAQSLG